MNISTTIKREYFDAILHGEKCLEYRADTAYWNKRLQGKQVSTITLLCGKDWLRCPVRSVSLVARPFDLASVIPTEQCWAIELNKSAIEVVEHKR